VGGSAGERGRWLGLLGPDFDLVVLVDESEVRWVREWWERIGLLAGTRRRLASNAGEPGEAWRVPKESTAGAAP